jgi:hypothetical protein
MQAIYNECAARRMRADIDAKAYEDVWYSVPCRRVDIAAMPRRRC